MANLRSSDIPLFKVTLPPESALMPRLRDVLYNGQISEGPPVREFEVQFEREFKVPNAISSYSGTAALHIALLLAGVRPGDDVVSTAMTAEPTNLAIRHASAHVVWADVDPLNGNLSADGIRRALTPRTRAVMVVHYGGIPASLNDIHKVTDALGIPVIEDAAHALGAEYDGAPLGNQSDYTMFSLQAIKHLTTVDGGMLACRDAASAKRGRLLRWFGIDREASRTNVDITEVGYKYHMNNVTATIGLVQLEHIRPLIDRHVANGQFFDSALRDVHGLKLCAWDAAARPSYWFYTVLAEDRDGLSRRLTEHGIGNSTAHRRNDLHTVFADSRCELPGLDSFYSRMLHIPCGSWVDDSDRERIVHVLKQGW